MHIILSSEELSSLDVGSFPNGSTIIEKNSEGNIVKSWIIKNGQLAMTKDYLEKKRKWREGEEEAFLKTKTKEDVLRFIFEDHDNMPYREYRALRDLEFEFFSFIGYAGMIKQINGSKYGIMQIKLEESIDLDKAVEEVSWALEYAKSVYPTEFNPIVIDIFEHTLSAYGIYELLWDRSDKFEIAKTTYGRREVLKEFGSIREALKYIKTYHFYE